ncbi:4-alpha-glucanotransferase [Glaesserella sp.]|uniref:4-alpha-glucanotransferase n=1 Tax=Glaesserella sp. TaxID=2094731 RepID=UPI00359F559C
MHHIDFDPNDYFYDGFNPWFETHTAVASMLGAPKRQTFLPYVKVVKQHETIALPLFEHGFSQADWVLTLEDGQTLNGNVCDNHIYLPGDLPLGYHQLQFQQDTCRIIVTPETAYQPAELQQGKKLWGAILQLYTLRSEQNWGVGDFTDLQQFLTRLAEKGGDFVGLNPIHSLFPANPESASPYSPSSRLWQNIVYIDVNAVEAFKQSKEAQAWFQSDDVQKQLVEARRKDFVDYSQIIGLKLHGLRLAYEQFKQYDQREFEAFIAQSGESLKIQGTFDALHQWLSSQFSEQWGWSSWDAKYHDYRTACVAEFQTEQHDLIRFYMWMQFVAQQQLSVCNQLAKALGMPVGFYRDLAVGVANNGAETWADKELYVMGASIGAPADMLAPQGQNWGLPPMHPNVLQQRGYQPFIDLLRANMKDCGALRIDHVLGLTRLWWVLNDRPAVEGVYIRYPLEDLLGILALESQRHQCLIIAEALGTVPEGILETLEARGVLAYNIFYFEFKDGESKPLAEYPYRAMTTLSTHDLPTVKGYWQEYDFALGEKYNVYPNAETLAYLKQNRTECKAAFRQAIEAAGQTLEADSDEISQTFNHQLQLYVADTNSVLFGTQPEDWLNMLEPVNIPGTSSEYPNWRRKLSTTTEAIFAEPAIQVLLSNIERKRNG